MKQSILRWLAAAVLLVAGAQAQEGIRIDAEYTRIIRQNLEDSRITTELVDHLPASDTLPTPLAFFGRVVGAPGELTYAADIARYYETLARLSPRAKVWKIGVTEEGRDIVALAIADEATIASLDAYRDRLGALGDPRTISEAESRTVIAAAKPVYWITAGIHSTETGGPETLIELAYRLIVDETAFTQNIRRNVITLITPVLEVDGREKQVDTYYFNKQRAPGDVRLPLVYWGKYVGHDNNRDAIGQFLNLTRAVTQTILSWHPTILHDLHEAQAYLYVSTGTGPYNPELDPIVTNEWWTLAENDVLELTRRGVPGVWTYGYYDGWNPNYMFFIANTHNAIGRFYEVQGYGPDPYEVRPAAASASREWFRPNPPLPFIKWGPRTSVNIQQSAVLFALQHVAKNRELYLENYWLKNKRSIEKARTGPTSAWIVPARQRRAAAAAEAVNDLQRQGLEISVASRSFRTAELAVESGDYIIRADQPYRTLAAMYFSIQQYGPQNPQPFDDTGWTFQLLRNIRVVPVNDPRVLDQPMARLSGQAHMPGGISGPGAALAIEPTAESGLAAFRLANPAVRMFAAEEEFSASGRRFPAGTVVLPRPDVAQLRAPLESTGVSATAVGVLPAIRMHELDVPRIAVVHTWVRTQDEGWWRAAFDTYSVPYTYVADRKLRDGLLRSKYDVIVFPHVGGGLRTQIDGLPERGDSPLPYKRTAATPNLGAEDSSDDIRGGLGLEGLVELARFVQEGGTLITEGSMASLLCAFGITQGVELEEPQNLFIRGSVVRGRFTDVRSPIAYGYGGIDLPVYFNQAPVLNVSEGLIPKEESAGRARASNPIRRPNAGFGQIIAPNAMPFVVSRPPSTADEDEEVREERPRQDTLDAFRRLAVAANLTFAAGRPRALMRFPANPEEMLLSGTLANGQTLSNRALIVDEKLGAGHIILFALRPFWRWQTQGSFALAFNAILNWNDLDVGLPASQPARASDGRARSRDTHP